MSWTPADVIRKQNEIEEKKRGEYRDFLSIKSTLFYGAWCMGRTWADLNRMASPEDVAQAIGYFSSTFGIKPTFQEQFERGFWKGASTILQ